MLPMRDTTYRRVVLLAPDTPLPPEPRPPQSILQLRHPPRYSLSVLFDPEPVPHPFQIPLMLCASVILPTLLLAAPLPIRHVRLQIIVIIPVVGRGTVGRACALVI
jgi:hypothetical protein